MPHSFGVDRSSIAGLENLSGRYSVGSNGRERKDEKSWQKKRSFCQFRLEFFVDGGGFPAKMLARFRQPFYQKE